MPRRTRVPYTWLGRGLYLGSLAPLASLTLRAVTDGLGANPIAEVENELGLTALIFLVATMACTPAKRILHWTWPLRIRRQLGLWAFTYASLHFLTYLLIDQFLDFGAILADIVQRPFITVGFAALVLLVPIAVTSTNDWVKRLGYQRWLRLHQLVYVVVALVAVHFIWRVKADISQPLTYAIILGSLLGVRLLFWLAKHRRSGAVSGPHPGK
ncbi:MAG TPA: protein-methionine-sulfoxide reductase heme-binding subunit MsrQ [Chloroflexota bacterium]